MTAATDKRPTPPSPHDEPLAQVGKAAILIPLIIGGAIIIALILIWEAHNRKIRVVQSTRIEEEARVELRAAYLAMRTLQPELAMQKAAHTARLLGSLKVAWLTDYADLKAPLFLLEGECLMMIDCERNAPEAEKRFDEALALMSYASGEMWQFGLLGRARARYEQGKFHEALDDLDRVLDRNPNYGAAYYWRAFARKKAGDEAGALADEDRARRLDSWPPLRDHLQNHCDWTRDIFNRPDRQTRDQPLSRTRATILSRAGRTAS